MDAAVALQVQQLHKQAQLLNELQTNEAERLEGLNALRDEVYRLRLKRKRLLQEVQAARVKKLAPTLAQRMLRQQQQQRQQHLTDLPVDLTKLAEAGERRVLDRLSSAYRLTGKTTFPGLDHSVGIRLETFFNGKYHESFYVMLREDRQKPGKLVVSRHTLPSFIPLGQLAQQLLDVDLNAFLEKIDDYLQAFVARREQALTLEVTHEEELSVSSDAAVAYVQISSQTYTIYLVYDDLCSSLPKRVTILQNSQLAPPPLASGQQVAFVYSSSSKEATTATPSKSAKRTRIVAHEHLFLEHPLATAYSYFLDELK